MKSVVKQVLWDWIPGTPYTTLLQTSLGDVLNAMGAIPSGFRESTLAYLLAENGIGLAIVYCTTCVHCSWSSHIIMACSQPQSNICVSGRHALGPQQEYGQQIPSINHPLIFVFVCTVGWKRCCCEPRVCHCCSEDDPNYWIKWPNCLLVESCKYSTSRSYSSVKAHQDSYIWWKQCEWATDKDSL